MDVSMKNIFVKFTKKDDEKRIVGGYASTPTIDSQGEIVEKDAVVNALGGYLGKWDKKIIPQHFSFHPHDDHQVQVQNLLVVSSLGSISPDVNRKV